MPVVLDVSGVSIFKQNYIFASCQLSGICFVFSVLLNMFVWYVRTICATSFIISLVIPSIPWALCVFILFYGLFHFSICKLGYSVCVWT